MPIDTARLGAFRKAGQSPPTARDTSALRAWRNGVCGRILSDLRGHQNPSTAYTTHQPRRSQRGSSTRQRQGSKAQQGALGHTPAAGRQQPRSADLEREFRRRAALDTAPHAGPSKRCTARDERTRSSMIGTAARSSPTSRGGSPSWPPSRWRSAYGSWVRTWSTWSHPDAVDDSTVVSEMGEQWSPKMEPASTELITPRSTV